MHVRDELLTVFEAVLQRLLEASSSIGISLEDERQRHAAFLLFSLIKLSECCLNLARSSSFIGIPIVGRSAFDAYVDLHLVTSDATYVHSLAFEEENSWLEMLLEDQAGNPYADLSQAGIASIPIQIEQHRAEIARRRQLGGKRLIARDRWEKAGLGNEYRTIFRHLSTEVHNNPRALLGRHTENAIDATDVVIYATEPPWVLSVLTSLPSLMLEGGRIACDFFGADWQDDVALKHRLEVAVQLQAMSAQ